MKILWLRPSKGDNISVRRERIAEWLEEWGFEITIQDASGWDALSAIWEAITGEYDVIAGNVRSGLYLGYPLARLLGKPFLGDVSDPISDIDYLSWPLVRFLTWYEWEILKRADEVVFVYESSYQEALDRGIVGPIRLPNAVNFEMFAEPSETVVREAESILEEHGVDMDSPIAMYIGVFSEKYRIPQVIEAAEYAPQWEFVLLGEGPLLEDVRAADEHNENVHYQGAFEYRLMPGFLAHADIGFCFKDAEQPLKLYEYGAAGVPTIVRPGELNKWYDNSELIFVDPLPEAIADTLDELATDVERRAEVANNLRKCVSAESWKEIAEGYRRLFESLGQR